MRTRWLLGPVVALVVALGLAPVATAAGGSTLSEKQWKRKANALCRQSEKAADEVRDDALGDLPADEQPSLEQITAYVAGIEPVITDLVDDLDALHEPKKYEKRMKRFVKTARRELARLVDDPSIGLEANPFGDTMLRAEVLGLKDCV